MAASLLEIQNILGLNYRCIRIFKNLSFEKFFHCNHTKSFLFSRHKEIPFLKTLIKGELKTLSCCNFLLQSFLTIYSFRLLKDNPYKSPVIALRKEKWSWPGLILMPKDDILRFSKFSNEGFKSYQLTSAGWSAHT